MAAVERRGRRQRPAQVDAIYTYGHPTLNGEMLDRLAGCESHQQLRRRRRSHQRGRTLPRVEFPLGNTPGILDGATADMAFTLLLLAAGRTACRRRPLSPAARAFTVYDPGYMLGREIHGATHRHRRPRAASAGRSPAAPARST